MSNKYVVILTAPVEEERCAMIALRLADLLNVSISKMTRLLSGRPGPLTKAIDKDKAEKLAKLLQRLDVNVAVVAETLEDSLLIPEESPPYLPEKKTKLAQASESGNVSVAVKPVTEPEPAKPNTAVDLSFQPEVLFSPKADLPGKMSVDVYLDDPAQSLTSPEAVGVASPPRPSLKAPLMILFIIIVTMAIVLGASYFIPQARGVESVLPVETPELQSTETASLDNNRIASKTELLKAANEGDADAQFDLAWLYANGLEGEQSYDQAAQWLEKAAAQGHANAQFHLGLYYYFGHGLEQDYAQAAQWLEKAAEKGVGEAQLFLGRMYLSGTGIEQNQAEAQKWLYLADEQGLREASLLLSEQTSTTLFDLAKTGNVTEISRMVEEGTDINLRDAYGQTPLMYAISAGNTNIDSLIDLGADVNAQTDAGWTSLMYAARDNASVIPSLLEHGADVSLLNADGESALDIALVNHPDALVTLQTLSPGAESTN